ncbi:type I-F CRISPR-associated protein Csy2 [Modicisalibacter tunisiensis]|uniref:Uncharacterized protein n=1 Tax=Modicisalibacter tunisiensis TaxID=390637 RepID=A0ABS7WWM9_9GAMM|nr:type I-F CRISPR-associated protein Csy2 [Modicisalibacter tunisiensis]MBZ9539575.1 hypothetical protein [Modicisalibacter tunisiensis]MBZ9567020.1 hypothetical protein [Modicisalibacter tunisiensis]
MSFLVLPHLKVQSANALACGFIVNASPVMAITQFVHNLMVRHLECDVLGVAVRHHHAEHQALEDVAYDVLPHQRRSALLVNEQDYVGKGTKGPTLSAQPTASCNLELSLLIEYEGLLDESMLLPFLRKARLAGGQLLDYRTPINVDDVNTAIRSLGDNGFWLIERPDLIDETDPLGSTFAAIERNALPAQRAESLQSKTPELHNRPLHEVSHAWVVPTVLGYLAITDFAEREGVRLQMQPNDSTLQHTLHAYAEPLLGMVQYVPARQLNKQVPYWRQHWLDSHTFVVQCHPESIG